MDCLTGEASPHGQGERRRRVRPLQRGVLSCHALDRRFLCARHQDAGRNHHPHRRFQDRSDADRRKAHSIFIRWPLTAIEGVLALFSDSTNAEHAGHTHSERTVNDRFESIFRTRRAAIVLSCFTSSIPRLQLVIDQAKQFGRVVSFSDDAWRTTRIAEELGFLKVPPGTDHSIERHSRIIRARKSVVVSGRLPGRADVGAVACGARRPQGLEDRSRRYGRSSRRA